MTKVEIICAANWLDHEGGGLHIAESICVDQRIAHTIVLNTPLMLELSKGWVNPYSGYVIRIGELILYDYFALIDWINEKGLRSC